MSIPSDFLEDEIRCGFRITKKRKEVWAVEIDLLAKLEKVCDEYELNYYADWGTLLGAIRHNGFIPWDDDIDVVMTRRDYEILCEIASDCFTYPYFFQTEYTDPGSVRGHAQLRNSDTTAFLIHEYEKGCKFNQGVFIDIFPLDTIPPAKEQGLFWKNLKQLYNKSIVHAEEDLDRQIVSFNKDYREFECLAQKYNSYSEGKLFGSISFSFDNSRGIRRKADFLTWELMPFEFSSIRVPCGYRNILRSCYGIWKEVVLASSIHGDIYFDTSRSYKDYIEGIGIVNEDMKL